ncbi:MAG TPA: cytochrome c [Bryobacteraceae bacterium]|nr:cytochrome c [Bryobacteraceae bacterium]
MRKFVVGIAVLTFGSAVALAAGNATEGKAVYDRSCKNCHGATGEANPAIAKMMKVEIANLGSPEVQKMSDADLAKIITTGKGKMQPIRSVTGKSVDDVVAYIRTLKK